MIEIKPYRIYLCEPPNGPAFECALVERNGGTVVMSTRHGDWQREPLLTPADLMMPEFDFDEWTITRIDMR